MLNNLPRLELFKKKLTTDKAKMRNLNVRLQAKLTQELLMKREINMRHVAKENMTNETDILMRERQEIRQATK